MSCIAFSNTVYRNRIFLQYIVLVLMYSVTEQNARYARSEGSKCPTGNVGEQL